MDVIHTALNRARLPIPPYPQTPQSGKFSITNYQFSINNQFPIIKQIQIQNGAFI